MRIVLFVSLLIIFLSQTNQKAFTKEDTATHSKQAQKTTSKSKLPDFLKLSVTQMCLTLLSFRMTPGHLKVITSPLDWSRMIFL